MKTTKIVTFVVCSIVACASLVQGESTDQRGLLKWEECLYEVRFLSLTPGIVTALERMGVSADLSVPTRLSACDVQALHRLGADFEVLHGVVSAGVARLPKRLQKMAAARCERLSSPDWNLDEFCDGQNDANVYIPDGGYPCPSGGVWVDSGIEITCAPPGVAVSFIAGYYDIIHNYPSDLYVDLTNDAQTCVENLWERQHSTPNLHEIFTVPDVCNGEPVNQTWHLWAQDVCELDTGYIDYWAIEVWFDYPPDLVIQDMYATPPNPEAGQDVEIAIQIANQGFGGTNNWFWVDFYRDRPDPPFPHLFGDEYFTVPAPFGPGEVLTLYTTQQAADPGIWQMWAQVDTGNHILEDNENNNVFGPVSLAWTGRDQATASNPLPWSGWWWPDFESQDANLYDIPGAMAAYDEFYGLDPPNTSWQWEYDHHRTTNPGSETYGHCPAYTAAAMYDPQPIVPHLGFTVGYQKGLLTETWGGGIDRIKIEDGGDQISPGSFWWWLQDIIRDGIPPGSPSRSDLVGGDLYWGPPVFASPIYAYEVVYTPIAPDLVYGTITISYAAYSTPDYVGTIEDEHTYGFSNVELLSNGRPRFTTGNWNGSGPYDRPQWLFIQEPGVVGPDENPYIDRDNVLAITQHQISVDDTTGLPASPMPRVVLYQNQPNPFGQGTSIGFLVGESTAARLDIYDILGRRVRVIVDGVLTAGSHSMFWDGRADDGEAVPSGVYFYKLATDARTETRRLLLVR